ncbi:MULTISPECIES: PIN domain-containing protein [Microbacterium]|uniref:PIN domain-containing protein n=1 Tax=Microbacterium TaxID=33882 RepID=UPI0014853164|nr:MULTISPECIES: PIN domain-containing protein [unclassified Microbacterium]MBN9152393.1 hypothetical protein [Microbacterium sp.]MCK9913873.1 PIN domain-containing protein [Microbacteriaceae bacterium K1510]
MVELDPAGVPGSDRHRDEFAAAIASIKDVLHDQHALSAADEIVGPDDSGRFPDARVEPVPVVVVDANVLRNDVAYACRREDARTTLVNAANAGFLRLFCAAHVVGEVAEHLEEWSAQAGIDPVQFEMVWVTQYVPLIRLVATVPDGLLSRDERNRVAELIGTDPDDVPSVVLSLLVEGFYLSEDGAATRAVYGERRDKAELAQWRQALAAGGEAGAIRVMLEGGVVFARLVNLGLTEFFSAVKGLPTWLQGMIAGAAAIGGAYAMRHLDAGRLQELRGPALRLLSLLVAVGETQQDAATRFRRVQAPAPTVQALLEGGDASRVLERAVLRELARSRRSDLSAAEIARLLRSLPVSHGEARVREVLRSQPTAREVSRGRW